MVQDSKKDLRRDMKVLLSNLDRRWIGSAEAELCSQLSSLLITLKNDDFSFRNILMWIPCFVGEPDLSTCIDDMLPIGAVYLPRIEEDNTISFHRISDGWRDNLEEGLRGIRQPQGGFGEKFVPHEDEQTLVVIPGIAFSAEGKRLGRGGGHYDKFLCQPSLKSAVKIGVCWSMQITQHIPVDPHDISMDWICYERGALQISE